jgi:hypothetical protein
VVPQQRPIPKTLARLHSLTRAGLRVVVHVWGGHYAICSGIYWAKCRPPWRVFAQWYIVGGHLLHILRFHRSGDRFERVSTISATCSSSALSLFVSRGYKRCYGHHISDTLCPFKASERNVCGGSERVLCLGPVWQRQRCGSASGLFFRRP